MLHLMKIHKVLLAFTVLVLRGVPGEVLSSCPAQQPMPPLPEKPFKYNGISLPERCYEGNEDEHIFVIGDYGGMLCGDKSSLGGWDPNKGNCGYGSHFPKEPYVKAPFNFKEGIGREPQPADHEPQYLVAKQMRNYAPKRKPRYIINAGDNFYYGGIDMDCGHPMTGIHERTRRQFEYVFEKMYSGPGLDNVPWFGILGNHDWGGYHFHKAWDQQIAYTWSKSYHKTNTSTGRWILPALYYHQRMNYPSKGVSADFYFLDDNIGDARDPKDPSMSNICSAKLNAPGVSCAEQGGPSNAWDCTDWFRRKWAEQFAWFQEKVVASDADWQILVAHFPPERFGPYGGGPDWAKMWESWGLDLFIGSHVHEQKLEINSKSYGGLNYVVVGGGGGITSEWNPGWPDAGKHQYGFMDLTISKTEIKIDSINEVGDIAQTATIKPVAKAASRSLYPEENVKDPRFRHMPAAAISRKEELLYKKKFLVEELHGLEYAYNMLEARAEAAKYKQIKQHDSAIEQ